MAAPQKAAMVSESTKRGLKICLTNKEAINSNDHLEKMGIHEKKPIKSSTYSHG
jgi:hypothetical protein